MDRRIIAQLFDSIDSLITSTTPAQSTVEGEVDNDATTDINTDSKQAYDWRINNDNNEKNDDNDSPEKKVDKTMCKYAENG